jgi:geranylgeranyl diphosphate synthase type II
MSIDSSSFNLSDYLKKQRSTVENALDTALPPQDAPPALLHKAMRYSVLNGGKRLRPILALAAAETIGSTNVILPAIAVELLHTYTLIHDDLPCMDDDDERRGNPTSHKVFGEANAILAGDALQALAFELAAQSPIDPAKTVTELAQAAGSCGVVGGQVADIAAGENLTDDEIRFIHQHKTADLFRAAIRMGAIAAGASNAELEALTLYGENIGLAFQIIDDILDDADPDDNCCSCIGLYGLAGAKQKAAEMTKTATDALNIFGAAATPLKAIAANMLERTF